MKFRTAYMKKKDRPATALSFKGTPVITEQAHKDKVDINWILADYEKTRLVKHVNQNVGRYDDVSAADFQTAMNLVASTKTMFDGLPSGVRTQFGNDASKFLAFVQNPDNKDQMVKMGIIELVDGLDSSGNPLPSGSPEPITPEPTGEDAA